MALLQQSRATRQLKVEDFYYKGKITFLVSHRCPITLWKFHYSKFPYILLVFLVITDKESSSEEEKTDLNVECAKLAVSISNNISKEVKTTVCGASEKKNKKSPSGTKGRRTKKSSILGKF